jgi:hypothetical protein
LSQPFLELVPANNAGGGVFGTQGRNDQTRWFRDFRYTISGGQTLVSQATSLGSIHLAVVQLFYPGSAITISLGDRHAFKITVKAYDQSQFGAHGDRTLIKFLDSNTFGYYQLELLVDGAVQKSAKIGDLALVPNVCVGHAFNGSQAYLYANFSALNRFGSGTACLFHAVDTSYIFEPKTISLSCEGNVSLIMESGAAHLGPFVSINPMQPDANDVKLSRIGKCLSSSLSNAVRHSQTRVGRDFTEDGVAVVAEYGQGLPNQSFNKFFPGSSSYFRYGAWPVPASRAGTVGSDDAYMKDFASYDSNVFWSADGNARLARLSVEWDENNTIRYSGQNLFMPVTAATVTSSPAGLGNNEYVGIDATPFSLAAPPGSFGLQPIEYSQRSVIVGISANDIQGVGFSPDGQQGEFDTPAGLDGSLRVVVFYKRTSDGSLVSLSASRSLSQDDLITLAGGGSLSIYSNQAAGDGSGVLSLIVRGIGPA